ncbi:MAG: hypothetical protein M1482_16590, partial [Chloroflexi bacterium]|nr:hypothetical protein [Chloroflexota bacterium]
MSHKPEKPFNSRTYQGQIERELVVGGMLVGLVVGGILIAVIWGTTVLFGALGIFALFLGLVFAVWLFL